MMYQTLAFVITAFGIGVDTNAFLRANHPLRMLSEDLSCLDETVDLSFTDATLTKNNLGGQGPEADIDEGVMMFENVANYQGTGIDLVVSVKDGSEYVPRNSAHNGMLCGVDADGKPIMCESGGHFGQINLDADQETTLVFTFYKHATYSTSDPEPIVLEGFKASFFDIDQSNKVNEKYVVKGWETALYDHDTDEASFSETGHECGDVVGGDNCLYAASKMLGKLCDNPHDPMDLSEEHTCQGNTVNQFARSFQVDFMEKSSFELLFKVEHNPGQSNGAGRNVVFGFASAWDFKCDDRQTPEPQNDYEC